MLINRLQSIAAFRELNLPKDYLKDLSENSTDELLDIIARVTATMLRHLDLPEDDISDFTEQVKERNMAELFENFVDDIDLIPKLTQLLLEAGRADDLTRAINDPEYRKRLYLQNSL